MNNSRLFGTVCSVLFAFISVPVNAASIESLSISGIRFQLNGSVGVPSNTWDQFYHSSSLMANASTGPVTWNPTPVASTAISSTGDLYSAGTLVAGVATNSFTLGASVYSTIDITGPQSQTQQTASQSTFAWNFDVTETTSLVIETELVELFGSGNAVMTLSHCYIGGSCSNYLDVDLSQTLPGVKTQILTVDPAAGYWQLGGSIYTGYASRGPLTETGGAAWDVTISTVPVPAAVYLFVSGIIGLVGIAKRKKW